MIESYLSKIKHQGFTGGTLKFPLKFTGNNGMFWNPQKRCWCKSTRKKYIKWAAWNK